MKERISIIGIGRLGFPLAVIFASRKFKIIAVDVDEAAIEAINARQVPSRVYEPGLQDLLDGLSDENLIATDDLQGAVHHTEASIILVPTPSDTVGGFALDYVLKVCQGIGEALRDKSDYHLVVVASTVMPGSCDGPIRETIEQASGKEIGHKWGLCYCPEFIALGNAIRGYLEPDFVLIGASDQKAGILLGNIYRNLCPNEPPIAHMSLINAEVTKVALNCSITVKITLANQLAELCEAIPGGNVDEVTRAIGLDGRIGPRYFKGGPKFGGPCLLPDALIQTSAGLKRIDLINVGDKVLAHDGRFHIVTAVYERDYDGVMLKIVPEGFSGHPLVVTPDHPVWAAKRIPKGGRQYRTVKTTKERRLAEANRYEDLQFCPASELKVGDLMALPSLKLREIETPKVDLQTHHLSPVEAKTIITPQLMKVFGFYISEGSTWKKEIKFSFHKDEERYVEEIANVLESYFGVKTSVKGRHGNGIHTRTTCTSLAYYLRSTFGHGAENKRVPHDWIALPNGLLIELLRGIWYGDGSNSGGVFTWATVSPRLFNFMKLAMLRLGIAFTTKCDPPKKDRNGTFHQAAYFLRVHNPLYFDRMNTLLPELAVESKGKGKQSVWFDGNNMRYHIRRIEEIPYVGEVYNLEVAIANSYMTESAMVHNCFPRDTRALSTVARQVGVRFPLIEVVDGINVWQSQRLSRLALAQVGNRKDVIFGILGMAYKTDSNIDEESPGMGLMGYLEPFGHPIVTYDPLVAGEHSLQSAQEVADYADIVVVTMNWPEFKEVDFREGQTVIDCWRMLDEGKVTEAGAKYIAIGRGA